MIDYKKFWTEVRLGTEPIYEIHWDHIVKLPGGEKIDTAPGKQFMIHREDPLIFGIEQLVEELGDKPDWTFNEPFIVEEKTGLIFKTVNLKISKNPKAYRKTSLYYGSTFLSHDPYPREVQFSSYIDIFELTVAIIIITMFMFVSRK